MKELPSHITPELIASYLAQEASVEDIAIIDQWIGASAENKALFEEFSYIFADTRILPDITLEVDTDAAWQRFQKKTEQRPKKEGMVIDIDGPVKLKYVLMMAAAALIPLIFFALFYINSAEYTMVAKATKNNTSKDTLTDGSIIKLNKHSHLTYPETFANNERSVTLKGEAFFEVAKNPEKPFIVHANGANIRVVGTSFNIKAYNENNEIEVSVRTGLVAFYPEEMAKEDGMMLEPGTRGIYNKKTKKLTKIDADNKNDAFWADRSLVFNRTELNEVAKVLKQYFSVDISFDSTNPDLCHYTGTFTDQNIDTIVSIIAKSFNFNITKTGNKYLLKGEGCKQ